MLKWTFFSTFACFVALVTYLLFYLGAFLPVKIDIIQLSPLNVIGQNVQGPYHQTSQYLQEVENWAHNNKIPCVRTFAQFLDNPDQIEESRLRSRVGCIVDQAQKIIPKGFFNDVISLSSAVRATFEGAPSISPLKVYPKVYKFLAQQRLKSTAPPVHIFEMKKEGKLNTEYLFPLDPNTNPNQQTDR